MKADLLARLTETLAEIELPDGAPEKLVDYLILLHKWNAVHNLTAIRHVNDMIDKHVMDSLSLYPALQRSGAHRVIDVGTGAGLPGMVLAICLPERSFYLLDSHQKKMNFVQHVVLSLQLKNVTPVCERVERYTPSQGFDWVVSRAFASLNEFVQTSSHLATESGQWVAMKGHLLAQELNDLSAPFVVERCEKVKITNVPAERNIIFVKKMKEGVRGE